MAWISLHRSTPARPVAGLNPPFGTHRAYTAPDVRITPVKSSDGTQWARRVPVPCLLARSAPH